MNNNRLTIVQQQRHAIGLVQEGIATKQGKTVMEQVPLVNITSPAVIQQELQFVSTTSNYKFNFGSRAPQPSATLNNQVLGDNDIFACYGIQVLIGTGANANNRQYSSIGVAPDDNSLYNGEMQIRYESNQSVIKIPMQNFQEANTLDGIKNLSGFIFLNPIRITSGQLATYDVQIIFPNISSLSISSDTFISVRLHGALGQA